VSAGVGIGPLWPQACHRGVQADGEPGRLPWKGRRLGNLGNGGAAAERMTTAEEDEPGWHKGGHLHPGLCLAGQKKVDRVGTIATVGAPCRSIGEDAAILSNRLVVRRWEGS
jgi:hypothetical protein